MRDATTRTWVRGWNLTLDQHYAAARELFIACEAVHRLWLISGDPEGPCRPGGEATQTLRKIADGLQDQFQEEWPHERDPYEGLPC